MKRKKEWEPHHHKKKKEEMKGETTTAINRTQSTSKKETKILRWTQERSPATHVSTEGESLSPHLAWHQQRRHQRQKEWLTE
jgi:hypothetical protein